MISSSRSMLYRFLILYSLLYAGFGVQSPYLPILLDDRRLRPETIALALAAGTAMRLMAAQAVARLADRLDAPKVFLALCTTAAARQFCRGDVRRAAAHRRMRRRHQGRRVGWRCRSVLEFVYKASIIIGQPVLLQN